MNPIRKALSDIKFVVPRPILDTVFTRRSNWRGPLPSLDDRIMSEVIYARVFIDCNLVGGAQILVPLSGLDREEISNQETIFKIPKDLTQGRSIVSPLNITFTDPGSIINTGVYNNCGVSAVSTAAQALMDSQAPMPMLSTANVRLIGENTILVRDVVRLPSNSYLRCVIAHDEAMSHIQPRSYRAFSKLVEYAVKAYIYNEYIVEMDVGEIRGGHQIGKFKEIIENYADAEELYQNYIREKWEKIEFQNDQEGHTRFLRMLIGGGSR